MVDHLSLHVPVCALPAAGAVRAARRVVAGARGVRVRRPRVRAAVAAVDKRMSEKYANTNK